MKRLYLTIITLIVTITISAQTIRVYEYDNNGNLNNTPAYKSSNKVKVVFTDEKEHEYVVYIGWGRTDANFFEVLRQDGGDGALDLITPSSPNYLPSVEQLQRSTSNLNSQIMNPTDGVIWIAYISSQRPTVSVEQGGDIFVVNVWETPTDQFGNPIKMYVMDGSTTKEYNLAYTIVEGNMTLKSVTF